MGPLTSRCKRKLAQPLRRVDRWNRFSQIIAMVKGLLIDLMGVLYVGDAALPGAADALARVDRAGLLVRFVTNTSRKAKLEILAHLAALGFDVAPEHVFTAARAACDWLTKEGYAPHLLVHPKLVPDFVHCEHDGPVAVVVGDAGPYFDYDRLNAAFRLLIEGAPFLALAANRVFRDADGKLSMDMGPFVKALEYASGREAMLMGKPAPEFFAAAASSMSLKLKDIAMIGDDPEADVAGALAAGAGQALLVRTGKYRAGDERRAQPGPSAVVADLAEAVDRLLG